MAEEKAGTTQADQHKFFGIWAIDEETDKKAFVIRCDCGETIYYLEKDLFEEPESRIFPGMSIEEFQRMQKNYNKFKGMKKQIQRVALSQHAEAHPECPVIVKMKTDAGVDSVQEIPNPFKE